MKTILRSASADVWIGSPMTDTVEACSSRLFIICLKKNSSRENSLFDLHFKGNSKEYWINQPHGKLYLKKKVILNLNKLKQLILLKLEIIFHGVCYFWKGYGYHIVQLQLCVQHNNSSTCLWDEVIAVYIQFVGWIFSDVSAENLFLK